MKQASPFGKFLLLDRINVGGMAEVFLAKTFGVEGFERLLAIKRILPNMADDDEFINMFVDEARIAVQLSHANIVQIYELGKFDNQYYIAMEYVSGKDLRQILDNFRKAKVTLPISAAAFVTSKICEGLDYAHRKTDPSGRPLSLIHRDVSPQNILVSFEGAVKVTDFGIAKAEDRASKTQAGVLKGKFGYMSPEQVRGLEIDQRSDIFAVGILLYEMVTGKRLFIGESDFSTLEKVRNAEIPLPTTHNPDIPPALETVMMKALAKERDERYQWASDLHDDLQQFLIEEQTIYNAKRLSALLRERFIEEIEKERVRMEEAMRVAAPETPQVLEGVREMQSAARVGDDISEVKSEKTMIFGAAELGSTGDWDLPTQIGQELKPGEPSLRTGNTNTAQRPSPERMPTGVSRSSRSHSRSGTTSRVSHGGTGVRRAPERPPSRAGWLIVGGAALASVLILAVVFWVLSPASTGTLFVTSAPTQVVDLYLDGVKIGAGTPFSSEQVPAGSHELVARAEGYSDKGYRFELMAGGALVINIQLERGNLRLPLKLDGAVGAQAPPVTGTPQPLQPVAQPQPGAPATPQIATVEIVSDPPDAKVRVGGLAKGSTPLVLAHPDVAQPFVFDLQKPGYQSQTLTVTFAPGEQLQKRVSVRLTPAGSQPAPADTPSSARLSVRSTPSGATVSISGRNYGETPIVIGALDPNGTYDVELVKDGFKDARKTVSFAGRGEASLEVSLDRKARPVAQEKRKVPAGGGGGGGGDCSGSGAKISVNAVGVPDCTIKIGGQVIGVSPQINKDAPIGKCDIVVTCTDGKKYSETRTLKAGVAEKLIIRSEMWQ